MNIEVPFNQVRKIEFGSLGPALAVVRDHGGWLQADGNATATTNTRAVWYNPQRCLLSEIIKDPAYRFFNTYIGLHGQWIERLARTGSIENQKEQDNA